MKDFQNSDDRLQSSLLYGFKNDFQRWRNFDNNFRLCYKILTKSNKTSKARQETGCP